MSQEALKESLLGVMNSIKESPVCANAVFVAETELVDGVKCTAKVRDFDRITVDEPTSLGGTDAGMNPVELVLVALGTCQEIMYAAYASVMGIPLDSVKVNVKGYLDLKGLFGMDDNSNPGYNKVTYQTTVESPADVASLKELVQTVESHCPVYDTLVRPIEVMGEVTINGTKI